jgi:UDP-N-acetylmuramate: L-alanyl-gamma-D-glutamyl-meso-diaminopimelate ligase
VRIHFIGICGTAMATLAAMLKARGHDIQGSDLGVYPPMSDFLAREGISAFEGYRAEQITTAIDLVVVGNAISRGNPELEEVLDRKIRFTSLPEMIRDEFLWSSRSVVIAGTHGKTTTTAMTGWLLTACGKDPSVLVGGISVNLDGSYRLGAGRDFVIEGDEYDSAFFDKTAKFLKYLPDVAVIGNLEYDHADIYADMEALRTAFRRFVALVPRSGHVLIGADSPEALRLAEQARSHVETFGLAEGADWHASNVRPDGYCMKFDLTYRGDRRGGVSIPCVGGHNVKNALAAMAAGRAAGLEVEDMIRALSDFRGVRRRLELRGTGAGHFCVR